MKNNFVFLTSWFPTLVITSIVTSFLGGIFQMAAKFIFPGQHGLQSFFVYCILTIIICTVLAIRSTQLGSELNRASKEFSLGIPVFNMLTGGAVYIGVFALTKGIALGPLFLFPCEMFMSNCIFGEEGGPLSGRIGFCALQFFIYTAVSLLFYIISKRKQENSEGVKKLRGEKKKASNRFGIDIDI